MMLGLFVSAAVNATNRAMTRWFIEGFRDEYTLNANRILSHHVFISGRMDAESTRDVERLGSRQWADVDIARGRKVRDGGRLDECGTGKCLDGGLPTLSKYRRSRPR